MKKPTNTFEEYALIVHLLKNAQKRTGVKGAIYPSPVERRSPLSVGKYNRVIILAYHEMISLQLEPDQIEAAIAHELGHVFYGHISAPYENEQAELVREQAADDFAAKYGYAKALAGMFSVLDGMGMVDSERDKGHPPIKERIAKLEAFSPVQVTTNA